MTGSFAKGLDDNIIELVFIGGINETYLNGLIHKIEKHINRKIRYTVIDEATFTSDMQCDLDDNALMLWED